MAAIPEHLIEYLLLGHTGSGDIQRYLQDGGIVLDVWLAFAQDLDAPQRVLMAPHDDVRAVHLGAALHDAVRASRKGTKARAATNVSPLESYVACTIHADELLRVVLPLTRWFDEHELRKLAKASARAAMQKAIQHVLVDPDGAALRKMRRSGRQRLLDAAPIASLIGVFFATLDDPAFTQGVPGRESRMAGTTRSRRLSPGSDPLRAWVAANAAKIAAAAVAGLAGPLPKVIFEKARSVLPVERPPEEASFPSPMIQRVFLDRTAELGTLEGISTIKADAATRVFDISCKKITWGIIDSGIATEHPAFRDHVEGGSRVLEVYDFTLIEQIRNFDLIEPATQKQVAKQLADLPGRKPSAGFAAKAQRLLGLIAEQLEREVQPDWALIEPLIRIEDTDEDGLPSDHGTHVAGVLAADWRAPAKRGKKGAGEEIVLRGVCPDIKLFDLRVLHATKLEATEFAILAALEYVQHVNQRAGANGPILHGVNISMSIPHKVRAYGCGATPVCVACDRLAASGVVVVAAAGNRGWNEAELGFGSFELCSITDPGNAQQVITVGATHCSKPHTYGVSYFSSRGPTGDGRIKPDVVAPGEKVRGPVRGDADRELDGTSQAAPFVSGAAAMLLARHRELIGKSGEVKRVLVESATDLGREKYFQGHGLVDVFRALQSI